MSYDWSFVRPRPGEAVEEALEREGDERDGTRGEHNQAIVDALLVVFPALEATKSASGDWEIEFTDESPITIGLFAHQAAITLRTCASQTSRIQGILGKALACAHIICREGRYSGWDAQEGLKLDERTQVEDVVEGYSHWLGAVESLRTDLATANAAGRSGDAAAESHKPAGTAAKPWWKFW